MIVVRHMRIIKYWLNIVMGNKSPYVAGLYHFFMRQVDINNKPSWVRSVKTLLSRTGFGDVWVNQGVGDIDIFMNILSKGWLTYSAKNGTGAQSLATNSPAPGPRPLTCGVSSECLGTRLLTRSLVPRHSLETPQVRGRGPGAGLLVASDCAREAPRVRPS